jgi:hypothetical protein
MVGLRCRAASIGGAAAPPYQFQFEIIREIRVGFLYVFATMFDTVKSEITTASGKLTHLRRFL